MIINRVLLLKYLKICQQFTLKDKDNLDLLCVLFDVQEEQLLLKANNLLQSICININQVINENNEKFLLPMNKSNEKFALPIDKLIDVLSLVDSQDIEIAYNEKNNLCKIDNTKIKCIDLEKINIPVFPSTYNQEFIVTKDFFQCIPHVEWASAPKDNYSSDEWLQGVLVFFNKHFIAGTDRQRLCVCDFTSTEQQETLVTKISIPKTINYSLIPIQDNEKIKVCLSDDKIVFLFSEYTIMQTLYANSIKIVDINPDNYFKNTTNQFIITKSELKKIFTVPYTISNISKLRITKDTLEIEADSDIGRHKNNFKISLIGELEKPFFINLSNNYFLSAINHCPSNVISVEFDVSKHNICLIGVGTSWKCVIPGILI